MKTRAIETDRCEPVMNPPRPAGRAPGWAGRTGAAVLVLAALGGIGLLVRSTYFAYQEEDRAEDRAIELIAEVKHLDEDLSETARLAAKGLDPGLTDRVGTLLQRRKAALEELRELSIRTSWGLESLPLWALSDDIEEAYLRVQARAGAGEAEAGSALLRAGGLARKRQAYEKAFLDARSFFLAESHRRHTEGFRIVMAVVGLAAFSVMGSLFLILFLRKGRRDSAFLRNILESIPHPLRVIDPEDFRILAANSAARREQTRDAATCYGAVYGRTEPCEFSEQPCPVRLARERGGPACVEHARRREDGRTTWSEIHAYPVTDRRGRLVSVIEHEIDITEKKEREEELQRRGKALDRRVGTLGFLYGVYKLTAAEGDSPEAACERVVEGLPGAWPSPDPVCARIEWGGDSFETDDFRETSRGLSRRILAGGRPAGFLEVYSLGQGAAGSQEAFSGEAADLVEAVTSLLGDYAAQWDLQAALAESEERHRVVVDHANDSIIVVQEGRLVFHNRRTEEIIGWSGEELHSRSFLDFIMEEDRAMVAERHMRRLQGESFDNTYTVRVIHGSGEILWAEINGVLIRWQGGPATLCFIRDLTGRMRTEERLRESEEKFRSIGAQAQDAIVMIDGDGNVSFWNEAAEKIFGYAADEMMGRNFHRIVVPERFRDAHLQAFPEFRETGEGAAVGKTLELTALKRDGEEIPVELSLSAVKLKGRWNSIGILRDVSDRKRMEDDLREAKERAEAASVAKSQFLANMSHEIRTPLNGIVGMTRLALGTDLDEEQRRCLEAVRSSSDHLLGVLNDILDLSKVEADRLELEEIEFDLRPAVEFTLDQAAFRAHEKGLELLCDIPPDVPDGVVGDPGRLRQIVLNLLNNSIKFTESGQVKLACRQEDEDGPGILLHFTVSDTGMGIPEEKQARIFEVFQQADGSMTRRFGGTGLGLAIAKGLCESMGGRIWVESEPGRGSIFHFTARLGLRPGETEAPPPSMRDHFVGKRVLIADDSGEGRRILAEMVSHWGLEPETAEDGEAALERMRARAGEGRPYAVALIDTRMPGMDGPALCRCLAEDPRLAGTAVVLLAETIESTEPAAGRIVGSLTKPVKQSELFNLLLAALVPAGEAGGPRRPAADREAEQGDRRREGGLQILLAEDNHINQMVAVKTLEKFGHFVTVAGNGREAVERAESGAFDVILMDGQMPVMDGLEATRLIRERERESGVRLPIIAMTAHAMKGDRERFLEAGMDDYIAKPIDPERLEGLLRKWGARTGPRLAEPERAPGTGPGPAGPGDVVPVDLEKALARAAGDKAFLEEMILHFVGEIDAQLERLDALVESGDAAGLARQAHGLKGSAATLGAGRIASIALQLEQTGKGEDLSAGQELLRELKGEMASLREYVNRPDWMEGC